MTEHKLVVVTIRSLRLSPGKLAAQVAHAAVTCALECQRRDEKRFRRWMADGQKKVVVRVEAEKELYPLKVAAEDADLIVALIQDAGHAEIPAGTVTCLGIGPGDDKEVDRITGHLALV